MRVLYIVHSIRQEVEECNGRECKGRKNEKRRLGWADVMIVPFWQGRGWDEGHGLNDLMHGYEHELRKPRENEWWWGGIYHEARQLELGRETTASGNGIRDGIREGEGKYGESSLEQLGMVV